LGSAFDHYKYLEAQRSVRIFQLQLDAIESPSAAIPISYSGTKNGEKEFSSRYDINITENNQIGNIDKYVVDGIVKKPYLKQILEDLKTIDSNPLNSTVLSTVGMQPNSFITQEEGSSDENCLANILR
jgi:hypothetical protein